MHRDPDRQQANAYVDGELDLQSQLAFEQRLDADGPLRAHVQELQGLSQSLRGAADYHQAPEELRARVAALAAKATTVQVPVRARGRRTAAILRWLDWRPLVPALALATVGAIAVNLLLSQAGDDERLQRELIASHVRATMTQRPIDVASSDQHTVKPWFATQLDYSPPVRALDLPGVAIVGGRVDYVDGRRVAVIVYRQGRHVVDHYIWPTRQGDSAPRLSVVDGIRIAQWTRGGMAHKLVSDQTPQELQAMVDACRRAEEGG